MKQFFLFFATFVAAFAQTDLPGPVRSLPLSDHSAGNAIAAFEKTGQFASGFLANDSITADLFYRLPPAGGVAGCLVTNTSNQLSVSACGGLPVLDSTIITQNATDPTKQMRFDNSGISAANTRVLKVQDFNYTLAAIDHTQTFTADQTFAGDLLVSGSHNLGSGSSFWNDGFIQDVLTDTLTIVFGTTPKVFVGWDNTNIGVSFVNVASQLLFEVRNGGGAISYGNLIPDTTNARDLGTSSLYWDNLFISNIFGPTGGGVINLTANLTASGALTATNLVSTSTAIMNGDISIAGHVAASNLIPSTGSQNIGSVSAFWNDAFIQDVLTDTLTIDFGTTPKAFIGWDNTNIGVSFVNTVSQLLFEVRNGGGAVTYGDFLPDLNNTRNLGSASLIFNNGYINTVNSDNINFNGTLSAIAGSAKITLAPTGIEGFLGSVAGFVLFATSSGGVIDVLNASGAAVDTFDFTGITTTGTLTVSSISGSNQCLHVNSSGVVSGAGFDCHNTAGTVTSVATSGPISGGTITGSGTISCPTCVTAVSASGPIGSSGGTTPSISCSTCLTTAGGQTITGAETFSGVVTANSGVVATIYDIVGGFFGQDRTSGIALMLAGGGTCTIFFKGGMFYAGSGC